MMFVQRMPVSPGARRVNPLLPEDGTFNEAHRNPLPASHRNELAVRQTAANWESNEGKRCAMRFNFHQIGPLSGGWQSLSRFPSPLFGRTVAEMAKDRNFFRSLA